MIMSLIVALSTPSMAAGQWTETHQEHGCTFYKGPTHDAILPIRAECDWPVDVAVMHRLLAASGNHNDYFSAIAVSDVVSSAAGHERVRQVHQAAGVSDREVMLDMYNEPIEGGTRYVWRRTADQTGLSGDLVAILENHGHWDVTGNATATHIVCELEYLAGGWVPGFMVRWFQGDGMHTLLSELRSAAIP